MLSASILLRRVVAARSVVVIRAGPQRWNGAGRPAFSWWVITGSVPTVIMWVEWPMMVIPRTGVVVPAHGTGSTRGIVIVIFVPGNTVRGRTMRWGWQPWEVIGVLTIRRQVLNGSWRGREVMRVPRPVVIDARGRMAWSIHNLGGASRPRSSRQWRDRLTRYIRGERRNSLGRVLKACYRWFVFRPTHRMLRWRSNWFLKQCYLLEHKYLFTVSYGLVRGVCSTVGPPRSFSKSLVGSLVLPDCIPRAGSGSTNQPSTRCISSVSKIRHRSDIFLNSFVQVQ